MKEASARRKEYAAVAAIVLLALAVRIFLVLWADRVIRWDEPDYLYLAKSLVTGGGFAVAGHPELHYTPLFPWVAGLAFRLLGDLQAASDLVYVLAGAVLIWPFYLLVRRLFGRRAALISSILLALCPALNGWVLYWGTMTEPLYLLWVFTGLWFTWRAAEEGRVWHHVAGGASFALAYLTRPEGSFYVLFGGVVLLVALLAQRRARRPRAWAAVGGYVLVALLVVSPYLVFLHRHTGEWTVTGKLGVTYDIGRAVLARDPAEYDRVTASLDSSGQEIIWYSPERFQRDLLSELAASPGEALARVWANFRLFLDAWFDITVFPTLLLVFVGLAWFRNPWDKRRAAAEAYWAAALLPVFVAFLPFHMEIRFFAPALPIALVWVGRGGLEMGDWAARTLQTLAGARPLAANLRRFMEILPTLALAFAFAGLSVLAVRQGEKTVDFGHRSAGLWLKEHATAGSVVMARDLAIALYAEQDWVPSPRAEMPQFLGYAGAHGVDYIVVDERELTVIRPQLSTLLEPEEAPSVLRLVYTYDGDKGRTLVYALEAEATP